MWIKWNIIWKDFFNSGKYLLYEDDGLDWLKEEVGGYLKEKQKFYNTFSGSKSEYHISDNTIYKKVFYNTRKGTLNDLYNLIDRFVFFWVYPVFGQGNLWLYDIIKTIYHFLGIRTVLFNFWILV